MSSVNVKCQCQVSRSNVKVKCQGQVSRSNVKIKFSHFCSTIDKIHHCAKLGENLKVIFQNTKIVQGQRSRSNVYKILINSMVQLNTYSFQVTSVCLQWFSGFTRLGHTVRHTDTHRHTPLKQYSYASVTN